MKLPAPPARKATLSVAGEESAGRLERNSSVAEYPPSLLAKGSELRKGYSPRLAYFAEAALRLRRPSISAAYSAKENKKRGVFQPLFAIYLKLLHGRSPFFSQITNPTGRISTLAMT